MTVQCTDVSAAVT